ncbi:hypothetical protein QQF64_027709 [Cirrhinus molitorella]|uniref:Uncharacterized protein n=1 Tax=Cirrhinus molitorella TaxID=172907 RepID=A0ABR3ND58_9TELE
MNSKHWNLRSRRVVFLGFSSNVHPVGYKNGVESTSSQQVKCTSKRHDWKQKFRQQVPGTVQLDNAVLDQCALFISGISSKVRTFETGVLAWHSSQRPVLLKAVRASAFTASTEESDCARAN